MEGEVSPLAARESRKLASAVSIERPTGEERLDVLDGFRAIAVLMVALFHYTVRWAPGQDTSPGWASGHLPSAKIFFDIWPLHYGWIGVELFFMISGFVILLTLERCNSILDFAVRRFARLWPPMVVAASLAVVLINYYGPWDWRQDWRGWASSVSFIDPNLLGVALHHKGVDWVDSSYWSLWVEVRFYLLAAILFAISKERFALNLFVVAVISSVIIRSGGHRADDIQPGPGVFGYIVNGLFFP